MGRLKVLMRKWGLKMSKLHLNLKRKWFDMILSGEKKEEYREIKEYYLSRSMDYYCGYPIMNNTLALRNNLPDMSIEQINKDTLFRHYDSIIFSNGYAKDRDQIEATGVNIRIDTGQEKWGAIPNKKYFVLTWDNINIVRVK